jgi:hypothetical protein
VCNVGAPEGILLGPNDGLAVGTTLGESVILGDGAMDGTELGPTDGPEDGLPVG